MLPEFPLRFALKALCLLLVAIFFASCDISSTSRQTTVQHLPDGETWIYQRDSEHYSVSHEITPHGSRISYYHCLRRPLEAQDIVNGELEIPTEKKQVKSETVGNLRITVWYDIAGGVMVGTEEIPKKPLSFSRVGRAIGSKEEFKNVIQKAYETRAWVSSSYEELDGGGVMEGPFPITSDMETIKAPLRVVVAIRHKSRTEEPMKKEILVVFSNHPEKHSAKLNRKIYQWYSIENLDGDRYRLISKGTDELYEGDFTQKRPLSGTTENYKMTIDIDGLKLPWSFHSDDTAGFIYYDDESLVIKITKARTFDEYLKDKEKIEWKVPNM
jgi:hypothetical protein